MASSGIRVGAIPDLTFKIIKEAGQGAGAVNCLWRKQKIKICNTGHS
jgi:hypothetical protein